MRMSARIKRLLDVGKSREHITQERLQELKENPDLISCDLSQARSFFNNNFFSCFLVMLSGLMTLMYIPSIFEVLDLTGNSLSPQKTFVRYLRTINHTISWFFSQGSQLKSLQSVRRAHLAADKFTSKRRSGGGAFITQFDMVVTQWAFVGPLYTRPLAFGLKNPSLSGLEALRTLMYNVGYCLGVEEEFNLCRGSVEETQAFASEIQEYIIRPAVQEGSSKSDEMADVLLQGINIINPFVLPLSFQKWCFEALDCRKKASSIHIPFPSCTYVLYRLQGIVIGSLLLNTLSRPFFLPLLNYLLRLNLYLANKLHPPMENMNAQLYM